MCTGIFEVCTYWVQYYYESVTALIHCPGIQIIFLGSERSHHRHRVLCRIAHNKPRVLKLYESLPNFLCLQSYKQHFFRFLKPPSNGGCYTLQYNANRSKVQEIKLENVLSVDERKAKSQANAFVIHCTDRKFQFACSSSNDLERWLETLRRELITKPVTAKPGKGTYCAG